MPAGFQQSSACTYTRRRCDSVRPVQKSETRRDIPAPRDQDTNARTRYLRSSISSSSACCCSCLASSSRRASAVGEPSHRSIVLYTAQSCVSSGCGECPSQNRLIAHGRHPAGLARITDSSLPVSPPACTGPASSASRGGKALTAPGGAVRIRHRSLRCGAQTSDGQERASMLLTAHDAVPARGT